MISLHPLCSYQYATRSTTRSADAYHRRLTTMSSNDCVSYMCHQRDHNYFVTVYKQQHGMFLLLKSISSVSTDSTRFSYDWLPYVCFHVRVTMKEDKQNNNNNKQHRWTTMQMKEWRRRGEQLGFYWEPRSVTLPPAREREVVNFTHGWQTAANKISATHHDQCHLISILQQKVNNKEHVPARQIIIGYKLLSLTKIIKGITVLLKLKATYNIATVHCQTNSRTVQY